MLVRDRLQLNVYFGRIGDVAADDDEELDDLYSARLKTRTSWLQFTQVTTAEKIEHKDVFSCLLNDSSDDSFLMLNDDRIDSIPHLPIIRNKEQTTLNKE